MGVINGMVNVFLGSINPALSNVDFSQTRNLGITIDADGNPNTPDPEMVPRQMIIPAFWAKNSENLAGYNWTQIFGVNSPVGPIPGAKIQAQSITTGQIANGAVTASQIAAGAVIAAIANGTIQGQQIVPGGLTVTNFSAQLIMDAITPPGTISAFGGTNIPNGWLLCDGSVLSSSQYQRLFNAISSAWGAGTSGGIVGTNDFNLPDLRGIFLRGVNGTRSDSFADPDVNTLRTSIFVGGNSGNAVGSYQQDMFASHTHGVPESLGAGGTGAAWPGAGQSGFSTAPAGGNETRSKNAYVNYIIKY